jgi:fatty-acyl-CoA synthase
MLGRMMDYPLTLTHFIDRARTLFPKTEIVSREGDGSTRRSSWGELYRRASRLAGALTRLGVKPGARVATLAWNHDRHLEAYFAIPAMGAVLHTLNLRLHPSDLGYIARHAEDDTVIVDASLLPLLRQFVQNVPSIRHVIVIGGGGKTAAAGETHLDYEVLLAAEKDDFAFPHLEENSAAIVCYTSGTTGNPKGVVFSHRSTVLHTLVACMVDTLGVSQADTVMPVVPMFHANAWGLPYVAACVGAKMVLPGPKLDPPSLVSLMAEEKVTVAAGVPTIWLGILALLDQKPKEWDLSRVRTMIIGGSAAPAAMIDGFSRRHHLEVTHAWGMTETNPLGSLARVKKHLEGDGKKELALRATQGYAVPFVDTRHVDDAGKVLPRDAKTMGELEVRGPWVAASYFGDEGKDRFTKDGWFKTGDVVTIDSEGYLSICDRAKDVIKSGGEWISSVELENALMAHPAVLEAAVFAGRHPKWDERPIAAVVFKPSLKATEDELTRHLAERFAKFWLPDAYVFMEQIPRTSTGKFLKTKLRELHGEMLMKRESK